MAAVETDKELNDLLDFTAVRSLLRLMEYVEYHAFKGTICSSVLDALREKNTCPALYTVHNDQRYSFMS